MNAIRKNEFQWNSEIPPSFRGDRFLSERVAYAASAAGKFVDAVRSAPVLVPKNQRDVGERELEALAVSNASELVRLATTHSEDPVLVSRVAEALAHSTGGVDVLAFLAGLLAHRRPFVRESALYGLAPFLEREHELRRAVESLSTQDTSPGVREAAAEVLMLL
jgi:NAD(P)-dependent dehydrogenase (short-subunit alcohol dehydrogenase family)